MQDSAVALPLARRAALLGLAAAAREEDALWGEAEGEGPSLESTRSIPWRCRLRGRAGSRRALGSRQLWGREKRLGLGERWESSLRSAASREEEPGVSGERKLGHGLRCAPLLGAWSMQSSVGEHSLFSPVVFDPTGAGAAPWSCWHCWARAGPWVRDGLGAVGAAGWQEGALRSLPSPPCLLRKPLVPGLGVVSARPASQHEQSPEGKLPLGQCSRVPREREGAWLWGSPVPAPAAGALAPDSLPGLKRAEVSSPSAGTW